MKDHKRVSAGVNLYEIDGLPLDEGFAYIRDLTEGWVEAVFATDEDWDYVGLLVEGWVPKTKKEIARDKARSEAAKAARQAQLTKAAEAEKETLRKLAAKYPEVVA